MLYTPLVSRYYVAPLPPFRDPECKMVKGLMKETRRANSTQPRYSSIPVNNENHRSVDWNEEENFSSDPGSRLDWWHACISMSRMLKYLHTYSEKFQNRLLSRTCREGLKFPPMPIDSQPNFPHAENLDTCFALFFSVCIFLPPPLLPLILFFSLRVHPAFFEFRKARSIYLVSRGYETMTQSRESYWINKLIKNSINNFNKVITIFLYLCRSDIKLFNILW